MGLQNQLSAILSVPEDVWPAWRRFERPLHRSRMTYLKFSMSNSLELMGQAMNHFLSRSFLLQAGSHVAYGSKLSVHPILTLSTSLTFLSRYRRVGMFFSKEVFVLCMTVFPSTSVGPTTVGLFAFWVRSVWCFSDNFTICICGYHRLLFEAFQNTVFLSVMSCWIYPVQSSRLALKMILMSGVPLKASQWLQ